MGARRAVCGVGERRTCSASGSEPHVTCGTTPCSCRMSRHASVGGGGGGGGDEVACRTAAATRRVRSPQRDVRAHVGSQRTATRIHHLRTSQTGGLSQALGRWLWFTIHTMVPGKTVVLCALLGGPSATQFRIWWHAIKAIEPK